MDVKNIINTLVPTQAKPMDSVDKSIKTDSTTDRDGNGQQQYQSQDERKPPMTEEEFKKYVEELSLLPAITEHNLVVEPQEINGKRFVFLKEPDGTVLRKITEEELRTLPTVSVGESPKGQLLRKTA